MRSVQCLRIVLVSGLLIVSVAACTFFLRSSLTFCEETFAVNSEWAMCWREGYLRHAVEMRKSPWVSVSLEVRPGLQNSNGMGLIFCDTLICSVAGPRREVERTLDRIGDLFFQ